MPAGAQTKIPEPPQDAIAAKAYAVLDQHCARCHQTGRLTALRPAGRIANILDLDALARNPTLVQPGNPDGSPLYTQMLSRAMPYDTARDGKGGEPAGSDLDAVRDWIVRVGEAKADTTCADRKRVDAAALRAAAESALSAAGDKARNIRFVTLTHLYNGCASEAEMTAWRQAAARLVNSLSWGLEPVALEAVDEPKTLLRIDLGQIGWDAQRWERLVAVYPYGAQSPLGPAVSETTGSTLPALRADWLACVGFRAPMYYDLLGLPDRLAALQSSLQLDTIGDIAGGRARRIGITNSAVARGSRLFQRHAFANGAYWTTYEYAPTPGRPDLADAPGGPGTRNAPRADANLVMFNLPSGFPAFFIANADGQRVNDLPQSILRDDSRPGSRITAGISCMVCHDAGPRGGKDEIKDRLALDPTLAKEIRDRVLAMHASPDEMQKLGQEDSDRIKKAKQTAMIDPDLLIDGLQPLEALAAHYVRPLTLAAAAAEIGLEPQAFAALAGKAKGAPRDIIERLRLAVVPRGEFEAQFAALAGLAQETAPSATDKIPASPLAGTSEPAAEIQLVLKTDRPTYKPGDLFAVVARPTAPCHLTLINVDRNGRGTVIYPNDFEQNNFIEAGREVRLPAESAPYQFRVRDPGRETIIGICNPTTKAADGIKHDFERQRFTELGDYRAFISRAWVSDGEERRGAAPRTAQPPAPAPRRSRPPTTGRAERPADPPLQSRYEPQARTAIQIEIK